MRFQFIANYQTQYPVKLMCQVLGVSISGYYGWGQRPISQREKANQGLLAQIKVVHQANYQSYGSPRVHAELVEQGWRCGHNRVARLMLQHGIRAKQIKRRQVTTLRHEADPVAPNLLERNFEAQAPNQKWLTDFTYIPTQQGWLYLAAVLDLYSRKIVGWAMAETMSTELTLSALQMALQQRQPEAGLLHHSDRGSQYTSQSYQTVLKQHQLQVSMSGAGNCYDNAPMESFFGTLKTELTHHQAYLTRAQARADIFAYIEAFYNRRRRHSALGYQSPEQFEQSGYFSKN